MCNAQTPKTLQWRHNERDGISNHQPHDCLLNCLFKRRENIKAPVTGLCAGNSPASNTENVSIWCLKWWRHHGSGEPIGRFPSERSVMRDFFRIIHIIQNKLLNMHSSSRWFKTPCRPCDITIMIRLDPVFNPVVIMISATSVVNIFRNNGLTCHICPENT